MQNVINEMEKRIGWPTIRNKTDSNKVATIPSDKIYLADWANIA